MTSFLDGITPEPVPEPEPVVPDFQASDDSPSIFNRSSRGTKTMRAPRATKAPPKPPPPYQPGKVRDAVLEMYGGVAFFVMPFKPAVSMTMLGPAKPVTEENPEPPSVIENCADAWEAAAKQYPFVRKMMEGGIGFAVVAGLLLAHAPILAAVVEGTPIAEKLSPASAMEAYLKRTAEAEEAE